MTLPRQSFGLNKFSTSISSCPYNADSIKAIVFQRNNLAVVNGASTEMELVLSNFYSTVNTASKFSFTLPGASGAVEPYKMYKFFNDENLKFLGILPTFGTGSAVSNINEYIEWSPISAIDGGILYDEPALGPSVSAGISFNIDKINCLQFGWGKNISYSSGIGPLWLGTDGGLMKWNGTDMKLWNTLNSDLSSDFVSSMDVDTTNSLWLGTSKGLCYFNEISGFSRKYDSDNSSLLSDQINDVKLLSVDRIVAATDLGMSILNLSTNTWESFDIYSTPVLLHNKINKLAINGLKIFLGTTGGLFEYDSSTLSWASQSNSFLTPGWDAPDDVKCLSTFGNNVYIGTTGGLVVMSFISGTAHTIISGPTGPVSSNITSLRYVKYATENLLCVGHDDGVSIMNIDTETWGFTADSSNYSELVNVTSVLPDFLSGATNGQTIWFGNPDGLNKILTVGPTFSSVPEQSKSTNLLMMYPGNGLSLYPSTQPLYFVFSKQMNATSFENNFVMKDKLTSSTCNTHGATVNGTWEWSYNNQVAKYSPESLLKSTPYELTVSKGSTASDSSYLKEFPRIQYYTENISPEFGWFPLGKLMILSGTNEHYLTGLYLRNPQSFDVKIEFLIGTI